MAKPRVFISSTFFDLRVVRDDIREMLDRLGYEAVLHERGGIPYEKAKRLEESCNREVSNCDIFVSIIGGRFGSPSAVDHFSISQMELRTAIDLEKAVFVFVEKAVATEYKTWQKNKSIADWAYVDDPRVYQFLDFVYSLPKNNPVQPFEVSADIRSFLRDQFAGLFQRLLADYGRSEAQPVTNQLRSLVDLLTTRAAELATVSPDQSAVLFANQPFFSDLRRVLRLKYRAFALNIQDLSEFLAARRFDEIPREHWDSPDYYEWSRDIQNDNKHYELLKISAKMFDDSGRIKFIVPENYDSAFISLEILKSP